MGSQGPGAVTCVARLSALAHRLQGMLDHGEVKNRAEIARLRHVTRARVTQMMSLLLLAPACSPSRKTDPLVDGSSHPICVLLSNDPQRFGQRPSG